MVVRVCAVALALGVVGAMPAVAQPGVKFSAAERAAVAAYPLTLAHVQQILGVSHELMRLMTSDPALKHAMESLATQPFAAQVRSMSGQPKAVAAVRAGGFPSVAEYYVGSVAMSSAYMSSLGEPGMPHPDWPASEAQIAFVRAHSAEVTRLFAAAAAP